MFAADWVVESFGRQMSVRALQPRIEPVMTTGFVTPVRRTVASRPQPTQTEAAKTLSALRLATGPGYMFAGVSERMLKEATRH